MRTPLHWHVKGYAVLEGNGIYPPKVYWRGDGCPPECCQPLAPGEWSTGVPEGREGLPPQRPRHGLHVALEDALDVAGDKLN